MYHMLSHRMKVNVLLSRSVNVVVRAMVVYNVSHVV